MNKASIKSITANTVYLLVYFATCFTTASDKLSGYGGAHSTKLIFIKFGIIFITVFAAAAISCLASKNFDFISLSAPIVTLTAAAAFLIDSCWLQLSGSIFLYRGLWGGYIMCAAFSLFSAITVFHKYGDYQRFFTRFLHSFTPFFIIVFILVFARAPFSGAKTYNFIPFHGTFKMLYAMFDNMRGGFEPPLLFFGNIVYFIPYGLLIPFYFKKCKPAIHIIIGLMTSVIIEAYQYIFSCGDADIDDLALNITGFIIGYIIYTAINKKILQKSNHGCSGK